MIEYREVPAKGTLPVIDCFIRLGSLERQIGTIFQNEAGEHWFEAKAKEFSQDMLKELNFKLHALNAPLTWKQ